MPSHFNAGNVWGSVIDTQAHVSKNGKPVMVITLDCSGAHGNVRTFGRLWGEERIRSLTRHLETNPGANIRLRGFFSMYLEREQHNRLYNFTFFKWQPNEAPVFRAAFVLRGEITALDLENLRISLHMHRPGKEGYPANEEDADIYCDDTDVLDAAAAGDVWEFKGFLMQGEGEDEYGVASGPVLPWVKEAKKLS